MVLRGLLKFVAGLVVVLILLLALVLGGGFLALRGFNPNVFRAELEQYLVQQTGYRIELGDMQLTWGLQPELQVTGLKLYAPQSLEKLLQSEHVRIDADLTALWRKRFWMPRIFVRNPEIFLKRNVNGQWNWKPAEKKAGPSSPVNPALAVAALAANSKIASGPGPSSTTPTVRNLPGGAGGWEFGLGRIEVENGRIQFVDETIQPAYQFRVEKLKAEVFQKTGTAAFRFEASASILGASQKNLEAGGDLDLISRTLDFVLRYGPDKALFKGVLKVVNTVPRFDGTLDVHDLLIESVIPEVYKNADYVTGTLNAKMQVSFEGANPASMVRSLRGEGKVDIRDGALKNRNLIKEVFERLAPVIAITGALGGELPPEMEEMLAGRDTPFQRIDLSCSVASGVAKADEFYVLHPNYRLQGRGEYRIMEQRIESAMQLLLSPAISAYLVKKIHELQVLSDRNGQVGIPFRYGGVFPDMSVQPDLSYIGSKLLQVNAEELFSRGLEKLSKILEPKQ